MQAVGQDLVSLVSRSRLTNDRSWHLSISAAYVVAWIVVAIIFQQVVYTRTNAGLFLILYVVTGLSLASWAYLIAVPFSSTPTLAAITGERSK